MKKIWHYIPWQPQGLLKEDASRCTPYREHLGNHNLWLLYLVPAEQVPAHCQVSSCIVLQQQSAFVAEPRENQRFIVCHKKAGFRPNRIGFFRESINEYAKQLIGVVNFACIFANDPNQGGFRFRFIELIEVST